MYEGLMVIRTEHVGAAGHSAPGPYACTVLFVLMRVYFALKNYKVSKIPDLYYLFAE